MPPTGSPVTVVVAADSFLVGDGLAALLAERSGVKVVGLVRQHDDLPGAVEVLNPDAVIIGIRTSVVAVGPTVAVARRLHVAHPDLGILVISDRSHGFALQLLRGGASRIACVLDERLPDINAVLTTLHDMLAGNVVLDPGIVDSLIVRRTVVDDLSTREIEVLEQLAHGLSNKAIAAVLCISVKAVEKNVSTIFRKLGLTDGRLVDRRVTAALLYLDT